MDIATIIGIIGGFALIVISILMGSPISAFINIPGLMIVVGGTVMATLIMQKLEVVLGAINVAMNAFFDRTEPPDTMIKQIVTLAAKARKGGLLALENEKINHPFLARGIRMAVDGVEPQEIIQTLKIEKASLHKRHETGQKVFRFMGSTAPAMGMVGTLIGLVQMLRTMNDPSTIGPAMAVALLTTFYGAVMAFLVFNPIAEKLEERTKNEKLLMDIIVSGVEGITKGINQSILEDKLMAYLSPKMRKTRR
ncbi:MAG TPA: flagellar motor protein PomA [Nitrospirae bacterium]|nr:flagellar motor protein PomA [Nitrospirota bacterium]